MPEPWAVEMKHCRTCEEKTDHQFLYHRNEWVCSECFTVWCAPEELEKHKTEVTVEDIWGEK